MMCRAPAASRIRGHRDAGRARSRRSRSGCPRSAGRSASARSAAPPAPRPRCRAGRRGTPGCRASAFSRSSISKQRGAEMSSRLIPPNPGAIAWTDGHDLVRVAGVQADREGVDAGELLEQHRLALHHRHRRARADVAEPEHGGAVGDDRDRVALDRVLEGLVGILVDRRADPRHARACRPSTGPRGSSAGSCCCSSILPPTCSMNVRSVVSSTRAPGDRVDRLGQPRPVGGDRRSRR